MSWLISSKHRDKETKTKVFDNKIIAFSPISLNLGKKYCSKCGKEMILTLYRVDGHEFDRDSGKPLYHPRYCCSLKKDSYYHDNVVSDDIEITKEKDGSFTRIE